MQVPCIKHHERGDTVENVHLVAAHIADWILAKVHVEKAEIYHGLARF